MLDVKLMQSFNKIFFICLRLIGLGLYIETILGYRS